MAYEHVCLINSFTQTGLIGLMLHQSQQSPGQRVQKLNIFTVLVLYVAFSIAIIIRTPFPAVKLLQMFVTGM